jgi:feruloyl esterase
MNRAVNRSPDSYIPPEKYPAIHEAVLNACDLQDGVKDGVVDSPTGCRFDPKTLACKGADGPTCLTPAQVETAQTLLAPVTHAKTGRTVSSPLLVPGAELGWATIAGPQPINLSVQAYKYVVYGDATWDAGKFDATRDIDHALAVDRGVVNSGETNLGAFFNRGGKLLMYHGWADPQVPALYSVDYFNSVVQHAGKAAVGKSIQLYMVPGMGHCTGGPGTDTFDKVAAIEQWMQSGAAPASIPATHRTNGVVDRSRPLCPFGQTARYKGTGSTDEAANFSCK